MFLRANPICVDPYKDHEGEVVAATEVDHITPKREGGKDRWDNLQSLCKACHSKKTAIEDGRWGRGVQSLTPEKQGPAQEP
jgi:5-methylcytosine-specific restriction protein A